jgi:hypothetical protein
MRELIALLGVASTLFYFVMASQSLVSLMGHPIPLPALDQHVLRPHHRKGRTRALTLASGVLVVVVTQAAVLALLLKGPDDVTRALLLLELLGAVLWVVLLGRTARGPT